jgi:hypothetical protein
MRNLETQEKDTLFTQEKRPIVELKSPVNIAIIIFYQGYFVL